MKNNERTNPMISDDEKFELLFKGLIETRDAVLFAVNDYSRPFQTSKEDDEKAINAEKNGIILSKPISNLDPTEKDAVSKYLYLKETLQSLPIEEKKLFIGEYLDRFLECRESEKALGFSKDKDGKFKFPSSFAGFLKRKANSKENKEQNINAYWLSLKEENKNKLIDEFCTTKEGKVNEAALKVIANSYDGFRSEEGFRRLEEVISYATQKLEEQSKKEHDAILTPPVNNFKMLAVAAFSMFASSAAAENTTKFPTPSPSNFPTRRSKPTLKPTRIPSPIPTTSPTTSLSESPTSGGFFQSHRPSKSPTCKPTIRPSLRPTVTPSKNPTSQPSGAPTNHPTYKDNNPNFEIPSGDPTSQPLLTPSAQPSDQPTGSPTYQTLLTPSAQPSDQPTGSPSSQTTESPTYQPLIMPTAQPSNKTFDYLKTTSLMPTSAPNNPAITDNRISDSTTIAVSVVGGLTALGFLTYALKKGFCNTSPSSSPKKSSGVGTLTTLGNQQGRI